MAFNFEKYKSNNPLLQEVGDQDDKKALNFDLDPQDGPNDPLGPDEEKYPRVDFENAVRKALEAGIDKYTLKKIIDWN